ncbi:hypothetical protein GGI12_002441 [Dipsacomyces acuminosporus]|nr:hypothetical protein GGI12_002441 [Dipsacomyces acuminosporus]
MAPPKYDSKAYWEDRFAKEEQFDWLLEYSQISEVIAGNASRDARVLQLGCGNSNLAFDMFDDGFRSIKSIDYCANVIEKMRARSDERYADSARAAKACLQWSVQDALRMENMDPESFDVVIDKSTSDCIACTDEDGHVLKQLSQQVHRLCAKNGKWLIFTYSSSRAHDIAVTRDSNGNGLWDIQQVRIPTQSQAESTAGAGAAATPTIYHYCVVCTKVTKSSP